MKRIPLLAVAYLLMALTNCKKSDSNPSNTSSFDYSGLRTAAQTFTVTAGVDQVITGKKGTVVHFYPNSFRDATGNTIMSGTINIDLTEICTTGVMIANNAPTVTADGTPLQSGGQVNIKATRNYGETVYANKYAIAFKQPGSSGLPMELYYGDRNNADSTVKWTSGANGKGTTAERTDTVGARWWLNSSSEYYVFDSCVNFNWVNCDHPFTANSIQFEATLTIDSMFLKSPYNTIVFISYPPYNSASRMNYARIVGNSLICYGYVPSGTAYRLVVISERNGDYYYDEKSGAISQSFKVAITPTKEILYDIKSRLEAL